MNLVLALLMALPAAAQVVKVDAASQQRYGVETAGLQHAELPGTLKGWAEVTDPQPLLQQWSALALARRDAAAARKEADRTATLNRDGRLASDRAVEEAAKQADAADQQVRLAELALVSTWGREGLEVLESGQLAGDLQSGRRLLVRLSLPAGSVPPATVTGATVSPLHGGRIAAETWWPDPRVNASRQPGYLLVVPPGDVRWPVGTPLKGTLLLPGGAAEGYTIPPGAVVIEDGAAWVFQQHGRDDFEQHRISDEHAAQDGWFVEGDALAAGEPLVVKGAQGILSQKIQHSVGPAESD
ncbi:hypothetical protein [Haloferula sargassicola]|uniref:Uncharacterized protein n=1 Tax=Haloferula sargassicola TaxID=490096 RepID=A0ABP9UTC5_9BACT